MNSKTKTVGGSPTTPLGQDFNQFLTTGLTTGNFGANANAQTSGFGGAINQLLGGQIGDPSTLQGFMQGLQGNGGVPNLSGVSGNYNSPQFQGLNFGQLGQINTQIPGFSGANLNQNVGGANLPGVQFNPAQFQSIGFQRGLGGAAGLDPNGSFSNALQQIAQQGLDKSVADVRERYTGQSGTPAGFAEAALRAQLQPQLISQLSQANQQERGLNLQQLGLNQDTVNQMNQLRLSQNLAGNQQNLQNASLGLNAQGINTQNMLQNQGLNNQALLGLNSQFLDQSNQQNQFNLQGLGLQQAGQGQNANNQLAQMAQMLQQNGLMNQFNQGNSQFGANLQQQAQMQNIQNMLQNQGMMNQFGLGQAGIGIQNQGQQLQAILGALGPLLGQIGGLTQQGTPQAQTVQTPSMFSQITGALGNLGQAFAPFMGNFGGGGGNVPQVNGQSSMIPGQFVGATSNGPIDRTMPNI